MGTGATRAEWAHWSIMLGLTEDLLPVVSRADAPISAQSTLKQGSLGKTPSRYTREREVVGIGKWTSVHASHALVSQWAAESDYGICLQTRRVVAFDFDCEDAKMWLSLVFDILGPLPVRARANSARRLALARVAEGVPKRAVHLEGGGLIELLGMGQQCVVAGTHPSGARYEWLGGLPEDVPTVSLAELDAAWTMLGGAPRRLLTTQGKSASRTALDVAGRPDEVCTWLEGRGWSRGWGAKGELKMHCPWEDEHTADTGEGETVYWPAGTGGYEQGHFCCLHAHCNARTDAEFLNAVGFANALAGEVALLEQGTADESDSKESSGGNGTLPPSWLAAGGLRRNKKGHWLASLENVAKAVGTPGWWLQVGVDTFRDELMVREWGLPNVGVDAGWRALVSEDLLALRVKLEVYGFEPVGKELARDAVELLGQGHAFDSAIVWLSGLPPWDGMDRVSTFLEWYFNAPTTNEDMKAYLRAVSRYWWTAAAGRILVPGCQADMVPVLVSAREGMGKTRGLELLPPSPEQYVTVDLTARDADLARRMRGRLVVEINELRGLHSRDGAAIRSWVTERHDTWIPKYQEFAKAIPRRSVVVGTSNDLQFLEALGAGANRRWLPCEIGVVDREGLARDRLQLWAQAREEFRRGGVAWSEVMGLAEAQRGRFELSDAWSDEVERWLEKEKPEGAFSARELILGIGLDPRNIKRAEQMRLAEIMKRLGFRKNRLMVDGERGHWWEKLP